MNTENRAILLVEDNPMDVDLTLRAFARRKMTNPIEVARDGQEALDLINGWNPAAPLPAVVLLDLKLPKVSGLEVLEKIRQHHHFCKVPVVVLTTSSEDNDIGKAYMLGVNSYIIKPVSFDKFLEVAEHIDLYWMVLNTLPPAKAYSL